LTREGDGYLLEDLGSSNGTFVNGQKLSGRQLLKSGDEVRLGRAITLTYEAPSVEKPASAGTVVRPATPVMPSSAMQTMIGEEPMPSQVDAGPPQLVVAIAGENPKTHTLKSQRLTIGRLDGNDIVIPSQIVSGQHARLEKENGRYKLIVLPEARNPVLFEGRPVDGSRVLRHGDILRIGSLDPGMMVTITYNAPSEAPQEIEQDIVFGAKTIVQIGRDAKQ
jgi:pSer/pThr/pTyr-binding forkhead associated (FHA) protein